MKITFATTNEGKIKEARQILGVEIEGSGLEIAEVQSLDNVKVASEKARAYYEKLKTPLVVEDVSLEFGGLNGLPGTYINDFSKALKNEGLIKLLENNTNREAEAITTLVYIDEDGEEHVFEGKVEGTIATEPRGTGFGWDPIFIPRGFKKTYGEMSDEEKNSISMRKLAFEKLKKFLQAS